MYESLGRKPASPQEELLYWILERNKVWNNKELGYPKPWSDDPVFQTTYFCNVHREKDRVTKWIRKFYSPYVDEHMFEYNIILARMLNWPPTLEAIGFRFAHTPNVLEAMLDELAERGKIWGGAYIITTHGIPMGKVAYLARNVMGATQSQYERLLTATRTHAAPTCSAAHKALQAVEGLGSFLAAQVVADLKNTPKHPLFVASDRSGFVAPGPGSLRGASWFAFGKPEGVTPSNFLFTFRNIEEYVQFELKGRGVDYIDSQDLQNCLCEYDKYMRVKNGTGKSKRNYSGV